MGLSEGEIIQINATIITGILILLTFSTFDPANNPLFRRLVGTVYGAVASIILPFVISSVIAIGIIISKEDNPDFEKLKSLRTEKIQRLQEKIKIESDIHVVKKLEKELKKTEKRLEKANKRLAKYDEERFYSKSASWRLKSLGMMIVGFFYIIVVIFAMAFSQPVPSS